MNRSIAMLSNGSGAVAAGSILVVDSTQVQANIRDFPNSIGLSGPTSARPKAGDLDFPSTPQAGIHYRDVTINKIVISDGLGNWRDPFSGAVV